MAEGRIKTVIEDDNRFDLEDARNAFLKLNTGRTRGKIVIKLGADHE
jgi:NADPH:quinone reductase-like Zn-dependent oxidoreductase